MTLRRYRRRTLAKPHVAAGTSLRELITMDCGAVAQWRRSGGQTGQLNVCRLFACNYCIKTIALAGP